MATIIYAATNISSIKPNIPKMNSGIKSRGDNKYATKQTIQTIKWNLQINIAPLVSLTS